MIAEFLRGEWESSAFAWRVRGSVAARDFAVSLVLSPDTSNAEENAARELVLRDARGWPDEFLFANFPRRVTWHLATVPRSSVVTIRHLAADFWLTLTGGTRRPQDSADAVRAAPAEENPRIWAILEKVRSSTVLPRMILVSDAHGGSPVALEGNARLAALAMAGDDAPIDIEVIHGVVDSLEGWKHA